jgi:hypothetical protein
VGDPGGGERQHLSFGRFASRSQGSIHADVRAERPLFELAAEPLREWAGHAYFRCREDGLQGNDPSVREPDAVEAGSLSEELHDGSPLHADPTEPYSG